MHFSSLQGKLSLPFALLPTGTACWGLRETSAQHQASARIPFHVPLGTSLLALEDFFLWSQRKAGKEKIRAGGQQSFCQCSCFPSDPGGFGKSFGV